MRPLGKFNSHYLDGTIGKTIYIFWNFWTMRRATMIKDEIARTNIIADWNGVRKIQSSGDHTAMYPFGMVITSTVPDAFWNLPFLLAYAVLDETLNELKDQGEFICRTRMLGEKMEASKAHLPWQNYDDVWKGKEARNDLAHEAIILAKDECFKYIDAVEEELRVWGIL